jgi:hypothetical protein
MVMTRLVPLHRAARQFFWYLDVLVHLLTWGAGSVGGANSVNDEIVVIPASSRSPVSESLDALPSNRRRHASPLRPPPT